MRLVIPLEGPVDGFVITGTALDGTGEGDQSVSASARAALDGGVGVVMTKITSLAHYPNCPPVLR